MYTLAVSSFGLQVDLCCSMPLLPRGICARAPSTRVERPACPPGPERVERVLDTWAKDAPAADLRRLQSFLELRPDMRFGSICSGTDISAWATDAFVRWARGFLDTGSLHFVHAYACEKEEEKREFLTALHGRDCHLFADAFDMKSGAATCLHRNKMVPVPPSRIVAAGFPCQDASSLNIHHATDSNRKCVQNGTLRTGSVAMAIVDYISGLKPEDLPDILILENVGPLAHRPRDGSSSGLEALALLLGEKCNFLLHAWKLCPRMFGVLESRARIWMLAFNLKVLPDGLTEQGAHHMLDNIMDGLTGIRMSSLDEYLVSKGSSWEQSFLEAAQRKAAASVGSSRKRKRKDAWQQNFEEAATRHVFLAGLTQRQVHVLRKAGVSNFPEKETRCLDVSQSEKWAQIRSYVPCVTPRGQHYITTRVRPLLGLEALRLQGLYLSENDPRISSMSDRLLKDLAGNSFEISCYMATLWSGLVFLGRLSHLSQSEIEGALKNLPRPTHRSSPRVEETVQLGAQAIIGSVTELTDSE